MKIDKKNKIIYLTEKDSMFTIVLASGKLKDAIGFKTYVANKGFGFEVFSKIKEAHKPKQNLLVFLENKGKPYETDYVGAWKLTPSLRSRVTKKGVLKPGRKRKLKR